MPRGVHMITYFSVQNYKTFYKKVELDFRLNKSIKRFLVNGIKSGDERYLKSIGIYGPNNAGKTCLLLSITNLKNIMLGGKHEPLTNSFINDDIIHYRVDYIERNVKYRYTLKYNSKEKKYIQESLCIVTTAPSNTYVEKEEVLIQRDGRNKFKCKDWDKDKCELFRQNLSDYQPLMLMYHFGKSDVNLRRAREDYNNFLNSISGVIRLDSEIDTDVTIKLLQEDKKATLFIKEFIKNCDLHIDDFGLQDNVVSDVDLSSFGYNNLANDNYKLSSIHKGFRVPSFIFDSLGTRKLIALSGYIYDAIKNGKVLLIDEIDSSLLLLEQ